MAGGEEIKNTECLYLLHTSYTAGRYLTIVKVNEDRQTESDGDQ